ncbi:hypothetical protein HY639_02795 [Candidatus Woesearchaeota archaeon]|nr:hypothetical protein [Candidatus Woesearchaeota archaeon]
MSTSMNKYLVLLSQENLDLAKAELLAVFPSLSFIAQDKEKLLLSGSLDKPITLALTKKIYLVHDGGKNRQQFAGEPLVCDSFFVNTRAFSGRRTHGTSATALSPKLACAMVHLACAPKGATIVDPFCGSGGILLEAALLGYAVKGYDLDAAVLAQARQKLASYTADVACRDACLLGEPLDAVISDLPYGKNTAVPSLISLYSRFLQRIHPLLRGRMVLGFPHFVPAVRLAEKEGYSVHGCYPWYLHRSLSKEILVLTSRESPTSAVKTPAGTSSIY